MSQPFFSFQYQIYPNRSDMVGIFVYMDFFLLPLQLEN